MKSNLLHRLFSIPAIGMMLLYAVSAYAQAPAATTVDKATRVVALTTLTVQSGSNFIRIEPDHLPATVTYTPGSAFGPLPTAMVADVELTPSVIFADCKTVWQWELPRTEKATIMEIKAHESATILVDPFVCPESTDSVAEVWDSIVWRGQTYTQSGDYMIEIVDSNECEYSHSLHLTVHYTLYDTVPMKGCDSLIYNEQKYTEDGIYRIDTTALPTGDRQVNFIDLVILRPSQSEMTVAQYDPYLAPWGETYPESGDYTYTTVNAAGCDSVITLHLTIYETAYDTLRMTECDSIRYKDEKYTSSCTFNDTMVVEGRRVIKTMEFTIYRSSITQITVSQYEPYISDMGNTYEQSGDYEERTTNRFGCDSVILLHISILDHNEKYDTVYFCRGYNREHEERISEDRIRRYMPYTYQSPSEWDYMEGVIMETSEDGRTLLDLARAEANLRNHYVNGLTPIDRIAWSIRYKGDAAYTLIEAGDQPQWINAGKLAVQIMFRCGEMYSNARPMDVESVEAERKPLKRIENGQVVILRGGEKYNLFGIKLH